MGAGQHDGVVVATDHRVIFLYGGGFGKQLFDLSYPDIDSVHHHVGRGLNGSVDRVSISGLPNFPSCQISHVASREARPFVELLRAHLTGHGAAKYSNIDDQWNAMGWGSKDHQGEREMLFGILDDGERIESLIGGLFGPDLSNAGNIGQNQSLHSGIVVATDRRLLFVDKGVFGSKEVAEMPYPSIETLSYSEGMFFAGVKITGRGTANYQIQQVIKGAIKPFVDCVRFHLNDKRSPSAPTQVPLGSVQSPADEIEKLANLLERGYITQEEFDAKKKELLGL